MAGLGWAGVETHTFCNERNKNRRVDYYFHSTAYD